MKSFDKDGNFIPPTIEQLIKDGRFEPHSTEDISSFEQFKSRRHLNESQRALVAASIANMNRGDNQHTITQAPQIWGTSQSQAAELLNVSVNSVTTANKVKNEGAPAGMVGITVMEFRTYLDKAIKEAKAEHP